jgi:hypothetical protein
MHAISPIFETESVREFVRKNAATFTGSTKEA